MVLIGELVKVLNLYSNPGVSNHSHVNKNSIARDPSKKFWMQNALSNWVLLTWSLCFITILFVTIVLWFLFSLFLEFALHNNHAFHSRCCCLFFFQIKNFLKKKGRKMKQIVFCTIFLVLETKLVNLFSHNMSFVPCLALMSLLITPY